MTLGLVSSKKVLFELSLLRTKTRKRASEDFTARVFHPVSGDSPVSYSGIVCLLSNFPETLKSVTTFGDLTGNKLNDVTTTFFAPLIETLCVLIHFLDNQLIEQLTILITHHLTPTMLLRLWFY